MACHANGGVAFTEPWGKCAIILYKLYQTMICLLHSIFEDLLLYE